MLKHHTINLEHQDYSFGIITSTLMNIHRDPKKHKEYSWYDVFPRWKAKQEAARRRVREANLQLYMMRLASRKPKEDTPNASD